MPFVVCVKSECGWRRKNVKLNLNKIQDLGSSIGFPPICFDCQTIDTPSRLKVKNFTLKKNPGLSGKSFVKVIFSCFTNVLGRCCKHLLRLSRFSVFICCCFSCFTSTKPGHEAQGIFLWETFCEK